MWDSDRYQAAFLYAAEHHRGQVVAGSRLPYVVHLSLVCAEVLAVLHREPLDDPDLAMECALLHDLIEDTQATYEELAHRFGNEVADGVAALTKDETLPREQRISDSLRRIQERRKEVWIVKLADRVTNLQAPPAFWSTDKRRLYREEAKEIHRTLGEASPYLAARLAGKIDAYAQWI